MATKEKIELKGAKEYANDLQKISQQSKILAAEMKSVASSFTSTTTAEEKYQKSAKKLTELYKSQSKEVQEIEKTLEKTAQQYGSNSREVDIWRERLAKAETALNKTAQAIDQNEQALAKHKEAIRENELEQKAFNEEQKKLQKAEVWEKIGNGAKICATAVAAVATAAAAAAKELWNVTKAQGEWADALLTTSSQTDISTTTLQEWEYAARFIDTEVETMQKGLARVAMSQKTAVKAGKDYIETIDGQRISLKAANGENRTAEQLFYAELEALSKISDETMQNAAAQDLFGKSFQDMKPLIDAGPAALKEYGEEAKKLGLIIAEDDVKALGAFDDEMQKFNASMDVSIRRLALAFLPETQKVAESLTSLATTVTTALADGFQQSDASLITGALFEMLKKALGDFTQALPVVGEFVVNLISSIIQFIVENGPMLVEAAAQLVIQLVNGIAQSLPQLIPACVEMITTIITGLAENQSAMVEGALNLVMGLVEGITEAIPILIEKAPEMIVAIIKGLIQSLPKLIEFGIQLPFKLIEGMFKAGGALLKAGGEIVMKVRDGFTDTVQEAIQWGADLIDNFVEGIKRAWDGLINTVEAVAQSVADFLGFSEPSKGPLSNFHTYAPDMMKLFAKGINDNRWRIDDAVQGAFNLRPQIVGAGQANTNNFGAVSISVYGAQGQDVNALADAVMDRLQIEVSRKEMAYA